MGDDGRTPLSLDEVHDLIDSWEVDPAFGTLRPATELLATMAVADPGRLDVLQVIADHQSMRGDTDAALATLDQAGACARRCAGSPSGFATWTRNRTCPSTTKSSHWSVGGAYDKHSKCPRTTTTTWRARCWTCVGTGDFPSALVDLRLLAD